jgi:hypothetical protein
MTAYVHVLGHIWQPTPEGDPWLCAQRYVLTAAQVGEITALAGKGRSARAGKGRSARGIWRAAIARWLRESGLCGDFREVTDFQAQIGRRRIPWASEFSEGDYFACGD